MTFFGWFVGAGGRETKGLYSIPGSGKGWLGGPSASVPGGVGGRGTGPATEQISQRVLYFCCNA